MSEDLQGLLEKINRDGVEKANAAAEQILNDAKAKAAEIVKAAKADADKAKADADKAAQDYAARAAETVAQAARDTILKIEGAVTTLLNNLLIRDVNAALADEKTLTALTADALKGLTGAVELAVPPQLAKALQAQLAAQKNITVVMDETLGTGFSVRLDNGRVEHTFTGKVVAEELAKRLRPDLAALLK